MKVKDTEAEVLIKGRVSRQLAMGFYMGAAEMAFHETRDLEELRKELILRAMQAALEVEAVVEAGKIAARFGNYVSPDQVHKLAQLAEAR